jgi:hypothetical protein
MRAKQQVRAGPGTGDRRDHISNPAAAYDAIPGEAAAVFGLLNMRLEADCVELHDQPVAGVVIGRRVDRMGR